VPADHKWFTHLVVAATMIQALERLDLKFPSVKGNALEEMKQVRKALLAEPSSAVQRPRSDPAKRGQSEVSGSRMRDLPTRAGCMRASASRRRPGLCAGRTGRAPELMRS
jgi:hypothetical protein